MAFGSTRAINSQLQLGINEKEGTYDILFNGQTWLRGGRTGLHYNNQWYVQGLQSPPHLVLLSNAQQLIIKTIFAHRHFSNSSHPDGLVVSNAHKIDGVDSFGSFSGVLLTWTMQGESVFETAVPSSALDAIMLSLSLCTLPTEFFFF